MGGLMRFIRRRATVWSWRVRYWWLDTSGGKLAQRWALVLALLVFMVDLAGLVVQALGPRHAESTSSWAWALAILFGASVLAYTNRPKPAQPNPEDANLPTAEDGQAVTQVFGTVWISDEFVLAFKVIGTDPIKK